MTRKALGKGLRELYGMTTDEVEAESKNLPKTTIAATSVAPNPFQPRIDFNDETIEELAKSIKEQGLLQPIVVRKTSDEKYQIISGERRFRALKSLGENEIPAIVREDIDDRQMLELALVENIQREDLNEIEAALSYKKLIDECNYSHQQLSDKLGKSRAVVTNSLRILKLPQQIQEDMLRNRQISAGHARALLAIENPISQAQLSQDIIKKSLSVREVEKRVSQILNNNSRKNDEALSKKENIFVEKYNSILSDIRNLRGFNLSVVETNKEKGKIEILFNSIEEFEKIIAFLSKEGV